jgi:hypothetical protein
MIQIDMEMPEKCGLCPLFHAEHPMHCQGVKADRKKKIVAPYGQPRPDWCLLHDVTADPDMVSRQQVIDALKQDAKVLGIEPYDQGYTPFDAIITVHDISRDKGAPL